MKLSLLRREKLRLLLSKGAEVARLAVIPGGQERRRIPRRDSGPNDGTWWDEANQRRLDAAARAGNEPPTKPAA